MSLVVEDGADDALHVNRRTDLRNDGPHGLVCAGSFILRGVAHRPGRYTSHISLEIRHLNPPERIGAGHEPPGTVGRGIIPIRIPLADADKRAVTHIHRNDNPFPVLRRYGTLAEYHMLNVDIIVNGLPDRNRLKAYQSLNLFFNFAIEWN